MTFADAAIFADIAFTLRHWLLRHYADAIYFADDIIDTLPLLIFHAIAITPLIITLMPFRLRWYIIDADFHDIIAIDAIAFHFDFHYYWWYIISLLTPLIAAIRCRHAIDIFGWH
jgi:hypothetical protein